MASEHWYWLASGLGWGAVNAGELMQACPGGAEEVYASLGSARLDEIFTQKQAEKLAATRPEDFALRVSHTETQGIAVLGYGDARYPAMLRSTHNPPMLLFVQGDLTLLNGQLTVGIVGARRPSAYGVEAVKAIGRGVALGGAIIVSGLAAGLDSEAHKAALAVNGPTIACIAFGHEHCYPASNRKLMEVIGRYGAVLSEYPPATPPEKPYFLQRNRLIAGLSHALVVAEARRHSGTMSTVNFAIDYGRDVFAVPGSIFSELSQGTNAMVREGAYLAGSASEILEVYGIHLQDEDPVAAAAKQAAEGRPAPASTGSPPWQQNLKRYAERTREERAAALAGELPGQQRMGDAPALAFAKQSAPLTAAQAAAAFRAVQQNLPAAGAGEPEARDAMLDERAAAVSDSVQLSAQSKAKAAPLAQAPAKGGSGVEPFPWHRVEHLDRGAVEDLSPKEALTKESPGRKKSSLASRLWGGERRQKAGAPPAQPAQAAPAVQPAPTGPVQQPMRPKPPAAPDKPVGRVQPIGGIAPVAPLTPVQRVAEYQALREAAEANDNAPPARPAPPPFAAASPGPAVPEFVPTPASERPQPRPLPDSGLAGRLKTLQPKPPGPEQALPQRRAEAEERPAAALLKRGARVAESPVSLPVGLPKMAGIPQAAKKLGGAAGGDPLALLSDVARRAFGQLGPVPVALPDICERSGLSPAEAMAALTELELAGLSRQLPGRQFVISNA